MRYRAEIDGLRAVAVVPVILFHAGFELFGGGFVGVDVFFVISGYLITSIILAEMEDDRFSLLKFYERRARRILPALFFIMLVSVPFAWGWLVPRDMKDFAESLVAAATFSSNFLFWSESGYFDTAAELKPFLHTWSLAVEEQYYIVFPLFLMAAWRLGRRWILVILAGVFVLSLGLAHWSTVYGSDQGAFFLPSTRFWEILVGVFIAFHARKTASAFSNPVLNQSLSLLGLALITVSVFAYDKHTPFPSLYTLLPTVGTALVILSAVPGTFANALLSRRAIVGVGLISYSAYLWHQPLFAFARHYTVSEPGLPVMISLCVAVLPLAYLTWRFVEHPFRQKQNFTRSFVFSSSAALMVLFISGGLTGHITKGFRDIWLARQTPLIQQTHAVIYTKKSRHDFGTGDDGKQDDGKCRFAIDVLNDETRERLLACHKMFGSGFAILGDSHAIDLFGLIISRNQSPFVVGVRFSGCHLNGAEPRCDYDGIYSFIKNTPGIFRGVVYEQAAYFLLRTDSEKGSREMFNRLDLETEVAGIGISKKNVDAVHDYLRNLAKYVDVLWFGPRIEPHITKRDVLRRGCDYEFRLRPKQQDVFQKLDAHISAIVGRGQVIRFVSQNEALQYAFPRDFMSCKTAYWSDGDHLSAEGEKRFGARFDVLSLFGS